MYHLGLVAIGGGVGAALRHAVNLAALRLVGPGFPIGTLAVNAIGGFLMGLLVGWFALRGATDEGLKLFLAAGVLGGFTTFSAFSLDAVELWQRGATAAALYVIASVAASIVALLAGLWLMRAAA